MLTVFMQIVLDFAICLIFFGFCNIAIIFPNIFETLVIAEAPVSINFFVFVDLFLL